MGSSSPLGEITSSSISSFVLEVYDDGQQAPDTRPAFGSFLKAVCQESGIQVLGVVFDVITGPQDTLHRATPLKMTRKQLRQEQPQIFSLLKTEVHVATCGYITATALYSRLPPHPPLVHDFVYPASEPEVIRLTSDFEFLRLISRVTSVPSDELLSAALRQAASVRDDSRDFLVRAGQNLAQLFRDDYDRFLSAVKKIHPRDLD